MPTLWATETLWYTNTKLNNYKERCNRMIRTLCYTMVSSRWVILRKGCFFSPHDWLILGLRWENMISFKFTSNLFKWNDTNKFSPKILQHKWYCFSEMIDWMLPPNNIQTNVKNSQCHFFCTLRRRLKIHIWVILCNLSHS